MRRKTTYLALLLCLFLASIIAAVAPWTYLTEMAEESCLRDTTAATPVYATAALTVKVNAPGYTIYGGQKDQRDQAIYTRTPVRKATDEFECKMWLGVEREGGEVPEIGGRCCDDFEMVFYKEGLPRAGDWAVDEVRSSPCADLFRYTGTTSSITLTIKEVAASERSMAQRRDGGIGKNEHKQV